MTRTKSALRTMQLVSVLSAFMSSLGACADGADRSRPETALSNGSDASRGTRVDGGVEGADASSHADSAVASDAAFTAPVASADAASDADSRDASVPEGGDAAVTRDAQGPGHVSLGTAVQYTILASTAVTNVPTSAITGKLGLSPAAASNITGLTLTNEGDHWTSSQVSGGVVAADSTEPSAGELTIAVNDMQTAYTAAAGHAEPATHNLAAGAIGGLTLRPGLYSWTSGVMLSEDLTLAGGPDDTWILQISGDLTLSAATRITLSGGAQAENIVWQVSGLVALGAAAHAEGVLLSKTAITLASGASAHGRLLAQTAVTLVSSTVTGP